MKVLVTGAAGRIGYSLIPMICSGHVFGQSQSLSLVLFDISAAEKQLKGVAMEVDDCSFPAGVSVVCTTCEEEAFKDIDVAILLGSFPRKEGMQRIDLLNMNKNIFQRAGQLMEQHSKTTTKVLVVGNPANTNALILSFNAPKIPKENITCLMRLDHNRSVQMLSQKLGCRVEDVSNVVVWGNHSNTQCPSLDFAEVKGKPLASELVPKPADMDKWKSEVFAPTVRGRGYAIISQLGASSAMSAAKAICDHLRDWCHGVKEDRFVTMGVVSDGSYGVPQGLVYGYPVLCKGGFSYKIVTGLEISPNLQKDMQDSTQELIAERDMVS